MTTVALIGTPNSGKTTLFNALTKSRQRVGNWSGVTVERMSGYYFTDETNVEVIDFPGLYGIEEEVNVSVDQRIAWSALQENNADIYLNVVDATSLQHGLFLTTQLLELEIPVVVVLTMMDVARRQGIDLDTDVLSDQLGCPVVSIEPKKLNNLVELRDEIDRGKIPQKRAGLADTTARFEYVDQVVAMVVERKNKKERLTDRVDKFVLHRVLAIPVFLCVMYAMFFVAVNVGSAFIDLFDLLGSAFLVEGPRMLLDGWGVPSIISALVCDGIGGGLQLVCTFIPVIGTLFLCLVLLEDSGYMSRIAFVLDKPLSAIGLPGKAFVPLIVGFGCNIPSVMGTRILDGKPDRILTCIMAPFMSCGARLTVYVLFASAFFPTSGHNIVFALYLLGIVVAIGTAWLVRKHLVKQASNAFAHDLPSYRVPSFRGVWTSTLHRLKGFIVRAGKIIVIVVLALNMASTIGTDLSVGNENKENSLLSAFGRLITPVFHPMGVEKDNWPATVAIFTGMFAKEVVVGTLDTLYTPPDQEDEFNFHETIGAAFQSVPENVSQLGGSLVDPLGAGFESSNDDSAVAQNNDVQINTVAAMKALFHGGLGAFSYLVFVLLYMPCVATIGVIWKEIGRFWACFSMIWSVVIAYTAAVTCYQLGLIASQPLQSLITTALALCLAATAFVLLVFWGKKNAKNDNERLIGIVEIQ